MEVSQARYDFFLRDPGCTYRIHRFPVEKLGVPPELGYEPRVATVWHTRFGTQSLLQEVDLGLYLGWFPRTNGRRLESIPIPLVLKARQCPAGMDLVCPDFGTQFSGQTLKGLSHSLPATGPFT